MMMTVLFMADATPSGPQWSGFWTTMAFLTGIGMNVATILGVLLMNRKQQREIFKGFVPVGKEEFDQHVQHNTKRHSELFGRIDRAEREGKQYTEQKVDELQGDITVIGRNVSALQTETKTQTAWLERIDLKLDQRTLK